MPPLTLGEAAKATDKSKQAILNAIKKGRISAKKNEKGYWEIDPAELHRIYAPKTPNSSINSKTGRCETPINPGLQAELNAAQKEIELLREQVNDLREDRNHWRAQAISKIADHNSARGLTLWEWLGVARA